MPTTTERLREPPLQRFAGQEHRIDLNAELAALRDEPHDGKDGHRQIALFHKGSLRVVLFAFQAGGHLPAHHAPGFVVIQVLRGAVRVRTSSGTHEMAAGQTLVLDPGVEHELTAAEQADVLLTISMAR